MQQHNIDSDARGVAWRQEDQTLLAALEMVSEEALGSRNWQVGSLFFVVYGVGAHYMWIMACLHATGCPLAGLLATRVRSRQILRLQAAPLLSAGACTQRVWQAAGSHRAQLKRLSLKHNGHQR